MIITVKSKAQNYDIVLERGALKKAGQLLNLNRKVLVLTDDGVPKIYADSIVGMSKEAIKVTVPFGEKSKSLDSFSNILSIMTENSFTRTDCLVAVGGGVIGDLGGFVASSYMRGIDFYNIPTTVLSQVDSSIGGKTAINFGGYKNIVGAFYPPKKVIIDTEVLCTLPKRQISNGLFEALKMSLTNDKKLFELFEKEDVFEKLDEIIVASLKIKKSVVEADEKEAGIRKVLNFGHTVAHAIESNCNLSGYYHGEAVALGMLPMCSNEIRGRLSAVLNKIGMPYKAEVDYDNLFEAIAHDKKMSGDKITVVFVEEIGSYKFEEMTLETLRKRLEEV